MAGVRNDGVGGCSVGEEFGWQVSAMGPLGCQVRLGILIYFY